MNNILKTTSQSEDNTPSIFVVCKESLDNEVTHGIWINCTQPSITIQKEITEMLAKYSVKNAKDWKIVKAINLGEIDLSCSLVLDIHMIAKLYTEFGEMFANLWSVEDNKLVINDVPFTKREYDVLACLIQGLSNKRIGYALPASYKTVETHLRAIMSKLKIHKRAQIISLICKNEPIRRDLDNRYKNIIQFKNDS